MKKAVLTAVALTAAISFSGCGLEPPKENPAETEAEQIIPQTETETQTETESETETETEKQRYPGFYSKDKSDWKCKAAT